MASFKTKRIFTVICVNMINR